MKLIVLAIGVLTATLLLVTVRVEAKIASATVFAFPLNYSGQCPTTITFTATIIGDPGTILGYQFVGDGAPPTKQLYGFIEPSGDITVTSQLQVDSAHAGSFFRQLKVTRYVRGIGGSMVAQDTFDSDKQPYSVTCVDAAPSPKVSVTPSPAPSPNASLDGVAVGEAPAPVLARLGLHPPGWARGAPSGTLPAGEVRQFEADNGNATMMLFFDTTIEVVMVQAVDKRTAAVTDPYGIKLNDPLDHLVGVRGKPDKLEDKSVQQGPGNSDTIDHLTVWRGLQNPIDSDSTYIYGQDDGIRWEYAIRRSQVNSIRVVDCRIAGMCTAAKSPH